MTRFVGGPHDGEEHDIHKNTEELTFDDGATLYRRRELETGEQVFWFDSGHQRRIEQAKIRVAGESLDQRMDELTRDTRPAPAAPKDRRRRR